MKNINWDTVQDEYRKPVPGGYAARITDVKDVEKDEYLLIEWEFAEGEFKGCNQETFDALGFWPMRLVKSYKPTALRFFKGFKTAVENSNRNYVFRNDPQSLVGKYMGVVLGEEEYLSKDNEIKTRLYVAEVRSGASIREQDFKVPALKKYAPKGNPSYGGNAYAAPASGYGGYSAPAAPASDFAMLDDDDAQLPF